MFDNNDNILKVVRVWPFFNWIGFESTGRKYLVDSDTLKEIVE